MNEMVERVARALAGVSFRLPGAGGLRGDLHLAPAQAREFARAAIEAMREPTEGMREAWAGDGEYNDHPVELYLDRWRYGAMIDAALAEDTTER